MDDKSRWDERYAGGAYAERTHPSDYLVAHKDIALSAPGRRAADLACGRGRNSWYLASLGFDVDAYDISSVGLDLASQSRRANDVPASAVQWLERDLTEEGLPDGSRYDLIIMFRFVALALLSRLSDHLSPGGILIVEEHLQYDGALAVVGPRGDRFRVAPGSLSRAIGALEVLDAYEGLVVDPDGERAAVARMIARRTEWE